MFHPIREQAVLALPIAERRLQLPPHPQPFPLPRNQGTYPQRVGAAEHTPQPCSQGHLNTEHTQSQMSTSPDQRAQSRWGASSQPCTSGNQGSPGQPFSASSIQPPTTATASELGGQWPHPKADPESKSRLPEDIPSRHIQKPKPRCLLKHYLCPGGLAKPRGAPASDRQPPAQGIKGHENQGLRHHPRN